MYVVTALRPIEGRALFWTLSTFCAYLWHNIYHALLKLSIFFLPRSPTGLSAKAETTSE